MVRVNTDRVVRSFSPDSVVEISNPGNGPSHIFPGRTREACEQWAAKFNRDVSKVATSGRVKVARVISIIEMRNRKEES